MAESDGKRFGKCAVGHYPAYGYSQLMPDDEADENEKENGETSPHAHDNSASVVVESADSEEEEEEEEEDAFPPASPLRPSAPGGVVHKLKPVDLWLVKGARFHLK